MCALVHLFVSAFHLSRTHRQPQPLCCTCIGPVTGSPPHFIRRDGVDLPPHADATARLLLVALIKKALWSVLFPSPSADTLAPASETARHALISESLIGREVVWSGQQPYHAGPKTLSDNCLSGPPRTTGSNSLPALGSSMPQQFAFCDSLGLLSLSVQIMKV